MSARAFLGSQEPANDMKQREAFVLTQRLEQKLFGSSSQCWTLSKSFLDEFGGRKGFVPIISRSGNPSLIGGIAKRGSIQAPRRECINLLSFIMVVDDKYQGPRGNVLVDPLLNPPIRVVSLEKPFVDKEYVRSCLM